MSIQMKTLTVGGTQFEIVDADARADIAEMQTDIDSLQLAVGTPLVAATKAAMTDRTKIYVYTGSESGMTAGNWYYPTGTDEWTSGGTYNSTAFTTDTTLAVSGAAADSKKTGDEITDLKSAFNEFGDNGGNILIAPTFTEHDGYYVHPNGVIAEQSSQYYTYFEFSVTAGERYSVKMAGSWSYFPLAVFYNNNDTFLSKIDRSNAYDDTFVVPSGASKMRINCNRYNECNIVKNEYSVEEYATKPIYWTEYTGTAEAGLAVPTASNMGIEVVYNFTSSTNFKHIKIPVTYDDNGKLKVLRSTVSATGYGRTALLDAESRLIGWIEENSHVAGKEIITITGMPFNVAYVVVNLDNLTPKYWKATSKTVEEYVELKNNPWYGKTIVWFGTSISACGYIGKNNDDAIPQKVGKRLGATIINEAVGSSCIHAKLPSRINASTNPYGFYQNFEKVSRCITNTVTEMQWCIDNYNSSVFTLGVPTSMTTQLANEIKSNSYENKLDPYLTENTFPDAFVFEHGYNDWWNSKADQDALFAEYGDTKMYSYRAGMDFLIKRILDYNPKAKIILIGNYCGFGSSGTMSGDVPAMQEQVEKDWNLPICKQWERLGWSDLKEIAPYGYWSGSGSSYTWVDDTSQHTMTVLQSWCPDGVHPHVDTSGKAVDKIVDELTLYLMNEVSES